MVTVIYKLVEGKPGVQRVAEYTQPPKKALINYIMQYMKKEWNWWLYPDDIEGIRQSDTLPDHYYYDVFKGRNGNENAVYAAYPM